MGPPPERNELRLFNPYAEIRQTKNRLPHWQQMGATYFVTFRLADALPHQLLKKWESERRHGSLFTLSHGLQRSNTNITGYSPAPSNDGSTQAMAPVSCDNMLGKIVAETLLHFDGIRFTMISFVVMPNHVHSLFVQNPDWPLENLIGSWKRFSAGAINKLISRSGQFWQRDYFDRLVRDEKHFANCVRYIRRNSKKARLKRNEYILYENEVAQKIW